MVNIKASKVWQLVIPKDSKTPSARSAHSMTPYLDRFLVLFGGMTRSPKLQTFEDVFLFDTKSEEWHSLEVSATPPGPPESRLDHNIALVPRLSRNSDGISDRFLKISSDQDKNDNKDCLLLYGGMSANHVFNDLFELIIDKKEV